MKGFNKGGVHKVLVVNESGRIRSSGFRLDKFRFNKETNKNRLIIRVVDE